MKQLKEMKSEKSSKEKKFCALVRIKHVSKCSNELIVKENIPIYISCNLMSSFLFLFLKVEIQKKISKQKQNSLIYFFLIFLLKKKYNI